MKASKLWSGAAILAISVAAFAIPATAHADTYKIYDLGDANGFDMYGIDTSGTVVIYDSISSLYAPLSMSQSVTSPRRLQSLPTTMGRRAAPSFPLA